MNQLYEYGYWAFDRVWTCIMPLSDEQFIQETDYSMGSIRNQVVHIMSASRRWMERLQGIEVLPHLEFDAFQTKDATRAMWDTLRDETMTYVRSLSQAQLDERFAWKIPTRGLSYEHHRWQILLHVANHATDHRAQILAVLHQHFGAPTVEQDLLFYLIEKQ